MTAHVEVSRPQRAFSIRWMFRTSEGWEGGGTKQGRARRKGRNLRVGFLATNSGSQTTEPGAHRAVPSGSCSVVGRLLGFLRRETLSLGTTIPDVRYEGQWVGRAPSSSVRGF